MVETESGLTLSVCFILSYYLAFKYYDCKTESKSIGLHP